MDAIANVFYDLSILTNKSFKPQLNNAFFKKGAAVNKDGMKYKNVLRFAKADGAFEYFRIK